ncbi:hypothetical protein ATO8_11414 [Roseivivax marinus]|uniref:Uncharacterized protein n=1 Tax=Roseivivax marinus TaxID=1379903 RepID=W4HJM5_9RHOB|nr:hypothetical protein [Roseivivax marinus]ETW12623.1 hypothetical protein ATO8_11414 [Roseivivax marinus]SEL16693.1 hypothetical protein SAMN05444413_106149 [Roseivivax marinus]
MIAQETRSVRIFAMVTIGLLLAGVAMLSNPFIGHWALLLALGAVLTLVRAIVLAVRIDAPQQGHDRP